MPQRLVLPRCGPSGPDKAWADRLVQTVQTALDGLAVTASVGIVVANDVTPPSSFDPTSATTLQTAQALATLLTSLQRVGIVK